MPTRITASGAIIIFLIGAALPQVARAGQRADLSFDRAPVIDAYTEIAGAWGLDIVFDRSIQNSGTVTVELAAVTAHEALDTLARAGGHAIFIDGQGKLTVAADTPQNRRMYETLEMATFATRYLPAKDVDRLLRSMVEARRITADPSLRTVTVRDTREKICVMNQLLQMADQPPSEIDLEIKLIALEGGTPRDIPHRLPANHLEALLARPESSVIGSFGMTLVGSNRSRFELPAPADLPGTMSVTASGTNPYGTRDITLTYSFDWFRSFVLGDDLRSERYHASNQTVVIPDGQTLAFPLKLEGPEGMLMASIAPRIVRPSALDPTVVPRIPVGTEDAISCPGLDPVREALQGVELVRDPVAVVGAGRVPRPVAPLSDGPPGGSADRPGPPTQHPGPPARFLTPETPPPPVEKEKPPHR